MIKGIKDIKILNLKNIFVKKSQETFYNINCTDTNLQMAQVKYYTLSEFFQNLTSILVIILGIFLIEKNMLSITSLLVIFMYKDSVYDLLTMFTCLKESIQDANVSIDRMFEIIEGNKFKIETYGTKTLTNLKGNIEFINVAFGYNDKKIIEDLNLKINANETVAIVGKSGSGKTTIFNLLTKNYLVNNGKILIDNIDLYELSEKSIKENISMVSQNPYIFNTTILENLRLVNPNVTKEEIIKVCKLSQIHEYICSLKDGYNTLIGEGGINLSGGQKQRIAIARALLRKSKIILFDEATSALDNETQNEILKSINNISKNHTIIIIAHRLSTIKNCNKIFVVDKGKTIAYGNHEKLVKECPLYSKLYKNELKDS